jgi:hypothetical protein
MAAREDYATIVASVRELLRSNPERVEARRRKAKAIVDGLARWRTALDVADESRPKRTRGVVLSITQGALLRAGRTIVANVEVNGRGAGALEFHADTKAPVFTTLEKTRLVWSNTTRGSQHRNDARLIREYLATAAERTLVPERTAQGQLLRSFFATPKHPLLRNLSPVAPAGFMMEIPAPVAASGALTDGTGNIDLLLRTGRGRNSRFVVCELKKPGAAIDPYTVLRQAIRYATALCVEVNGIEGAIAPANPALYRKLYGASGNSKLRFGAMAAIDAQNEPRVREALVVLHPPARPAAWLEVLLYREDASATSRGPSRSATCVITPVERVRAR